MNSQTSIQTLNKMRKYLEIRLEKEIKSSFKDKWVKEEKIRLDQELRKKYEEKTKRYNRKNKEDYNEYYKKYYDEKREHLSLQVKQLILVNKINKEKIYDREYTIQALKDPEWASKMSSHNLDERIKSYIIEIKEIHNKLYKLEEKIWKNLEKKDRLFYHS